ncbi:MAG: glutathionylspermidine synthase family protein [Deltaproteobacteria bacterium]|nr:glutathionylspermidine synthase family protein [Deltaproteobacteria bacterium]
MSIVDDKQEMGRQEENWQTHTPQILPEERPYVNFANELQDTCLVNDPWWEGEPTYRSAPLVVPRPFFNALMGAGERIGKLFAELSSVVEANPVLLDEFYHLPKFYKLMWLSSEGWWHGFARMDMFQLADGSLKICELNADTPSGQVETLVPASLIAPRFPQYENPNQYYKERFMALLLKYHQARTGDESKPKAVGIVYPTDLPEDITLIRLYQQWLEEAGIEAPLGSPYNLEKLNDGRLSLFGTPIDVVLRHYKTDWWGERPAIWTHEDNDIPDPDPLEDELFRILEAERDGKVAVVNPFGSLIPQNKLSMALMWERMELFSEESQATIKELIPPTYRLETAGYEEVKRTKNRWVLKSDFGCEGDEVLIGPLQDQDDWEASIDTTVPGMWIVQEFFDIKPIDEMLPNYGVYLIAGKPSGLLVRLAPEGAEKDLSAQVVTPLVSDE